MKKYSASIITLLSVLFLFFYLPDGINKDNILTINSPDNSISIRFFINKKSNDHKDGIFYEVKKNNKIIITPSLLGVTFDPLLDFSKNIKIISTETGKINEKYELPWGEQRTVNNNANTLKLYISKKNDDTKKISIECRLYDDGFGIRYHFNTGTKDDLFITKEHTSFNLSEDYTTFWIPGDWDTYEHLYTKSKLSKINAFKKRNHKSLNSTTIPENAVNTPVTMVGKDGLHLSFHEAALVKYPGMTLKVDTVGLSLQASLVGSENHTYLAKIKDGTSTPWRTVQIAEKATDLITSNLIINLNEPNKLGNIDWFKPSKYTGIWWEMHIGMSSWDKKSGKHGATTKRAKEFIDFSAQNNIGGVLVEGWNTGWEHWIGFDDREGVFDFVTPYKDYDIEEVVKYGKSKGVDIIMHHETSSGTQTYEKQAEKAYQLMEDLGLHIVKTGYVGNILPKGEYHHGQYMVEHHQKIADIAAKHKVAVNAHEPIKPTGLRRTYPNIISREGLRGQEFNAWSSDGGNPPNHLPIVAFTRMLAGPIDFTPGIFNISLKPFKENNRISTTITQQLALYVVIYSPIQMAADIIKHYKENMKPFQFIKEVGVDWEKSITLGGEVGEYVTIARQEKNTLNWFLGSITNEKSRTININFDFLEKGQSYEMSVYQDAGDAHYKNNPTAIKIHNKIPIQSTDQKSFYLAPGGGLALSIFKK